MDSNNDCNNINSNINNNSNNLNLSFKKPNNGTILAMGNVVNGVYSKNDTNNLLYELKEKTSNITNHSYVEILNRGNSAIFLAMNYFNGSIFIPDQGAWRGFKQAGKALNKDIIQFNTDYGLIDIESLENVFIANNINNIANGNNDTNNNNKNNSAIFLTSFAGYTAEQNIKEISKLAKDYGVAIVEDASGAINDPKGNLANGKYSDIIIASTGSPKIINVGNGAIITAKDDFIFKENNFLTKILAANTVTVAGINTEIDFAKESLKKTLSASKYIKNNLGITNNSNHSSDNDNDNVIHSRKRGINVIIKNDLSNFWDLKKELSINGGSMVTKCPSYDRVKEKAIAIEIKNLDTNCLNKNNLDGIINILEKYIDFSS
ncbi:MAG: DegT/DnrJ/EryC1/StrS family aminotransferase [Methanobacteriaceae archaeon]